jgi:hypothetical protein
MFGARSAADPDGGLRIDIGQVGQQLAKVLVIGRLELVLDDHAVVVLILRDEVNLEVAREELPLRIGQGNADRLGQGIKVALKPRRESALFVLSKLTKGNWFELSNVGHCRYAPSGRLILRSSRLQPFRIPRTANPSAREFGSSYLGSDNLAEPLTNLT